MLMLVRKLERKNGAETEHRVEAKHKGKILLLLERPVQLGMLLLAKKEKSWLSGISRRPRLFRKRWKP